MRYGFIQNILRRHLRSPTLYRLSRQALLLFQYVTRQPDDAEYIAFKAQATRQRGVVVDIGANGGQSAIAFGFLLPHHTIISFEPNPTLWPELKFISLILGRRFRFYRFALGDQHGQISLNVPFLGTFPITTRASLDPEMAIQKSLSLTGNGSNNLSVATFTVEIRRFDDLCIHPDAIKIDVEGAELEVLHGMVYTLRTLRPFLMIESNPRDIECQRFLEAHGYKKIFFDTTNKRFSLEQPPLTRNWFAVSEEEYAQLFCKNPPVNF